MRLQKTDKARMELQPGVRTLGQRERTLLLLADGHKASKDFSALFNGEGEKLLLQLISDGYLTHTSPALRAAMDTPPGPQVAATPPTPSVQAPVRVCVDQFEGKRSLATTRMFLFDICERMFARRSPSQAEFFREALRNARDPESMLCAAREMIEEIENVAGHERADSISERIAMLMPA